MLNPLKSNFFDFIVNILHLLHGPISASISDTAYYFNSLFSMSDSIFIVCMLRSFAKNQAPTGKASLRVALTCPEPTITSHRGLHQDPQVQHSHFILFLQLVFFPCGPSSIQHNQFIPLLLQSLTRMAAWQAPTMWPIKETHSITNRDIPHPAMQHTPSCPTTSTSWRSEAGVGHSRTWPVWKSPIKELQGEKPAHTHYREIKDVHTTHTETSTTYRRSQAKKKDLMTAVSLGHVRLNGNITIAASVWYTESGTGDLASLELSFSLRSLSSKNLKRLKTKSCVSLT